MEGGAGITMSSLLLSSHLRVRYEMFDSSGALVDDCHPILGGVGRAGGEHGAHARGLHMDVQQVAKGVGAEHVGVDHKEGGGGGHDELLDEEARGEEDGRGVDGVGS